MNETIKALDQLVSKLLVNLLSTKMWVTAGGMILSAWLAYQVGGKEAALAAIAASLGLGGIYTGAKTYQNTHGNNSINGNGTQAEVRSPPATPQQQQQPSAQPAQPAQPAQYLTPFDPMALKLTGDTALMRYESIQDLMVYKDLTEYHPAVRLDFAMLITQRAERELSDAWLEETSRGGFSYPMPSRDTFKSYDAIQKHKLSTQATSPKCQWLPENIDTIYSELAKVYQTQDTISLLRDKPIAWLKNGIPYITTIENIRLEGLKAVKTNGG